MILGFSLGSMACLGLISLGIGNSRYIAYEHYLFQDLAAWGGATLTGIGILGLVILFI